MVNPQIINGGQTAYTLSQVFRDHEEPDRSKIFGDKEVLVKIITFDIESKLGDSQKLKLIEAISRATNSQSVVSHADRRSNEEDLKILQSRCFDSFGIWLERKRGEFMDGIREGYIDPALIVDRNLFVRAAAIACGRLSLANAKKAFVRSDFSAFVSAPEEQFLRYNIALQILRWIHEEKGPIRARLHGVVVYQAYVALLLVTSKTSETEVGQELISEVANAVKQHWFNFGQHLERTYQEDSYWKNSRKGRNFNISDYLKRDHVLEDVTEFFDAPDRHGQILREEATTEIRPPESVQSAQDIGEFISKDTGPIMPVELFIQSIKEDDEKSG